MKKVIPNSVALIGFCLLFISIITISMFSESEKKIVKSKRRMALVIGNRDYREATPLRILRNPINDANDISEILIKLEFDVVKKYDVNKKQMENLIKNFGKKLKKGGVGLFYYAGHGFQFNRVNYLIPIVNINTEISNITNVRNGIEKKAVSVDFVLKEMDKAGNDFNIVILDACRNNPFGIRGTIPIAKKGFLETHAPKKSKYGFFIVYSAAPGETASDGEGINGLFTEHLLENIAKPRLEIGNLITIVTDRVREATRGEQIPWRGGWKGADFYFNHGENDLSKVQEIWEIPQITNDVGYTDRKTIKKSAGAFGNSYEDAFKKARTKIVRNFFKGYPSNKEYKKTVRGIHRLREKRMPDESFFIEVSIEFYLEEEK